MALIHKGKERNLVAEDDSLVNRRLLHELQQGRPLIGEGRFRGFLLSIFSTAVNEDLHHKQIPQRLVAAAGSNQASPAPIPPLQCFLTQSRIGQMQPHPGPILNG